MWLLIGISLCGSLSADSAAGRAAHDVDSLQHPRRDRHASHRRGEFFYYVIWGYRGYETAFLRSVDQKVFALFYGAGEQIKRVFRCCRQGTGSENGSKKVGRLVHLQGYAYLNALFFARHRRQLVKPVKIRLLLILAVFLGGLAFAFLDPAKAQQAAGQIVSFLPFLFSSCILCP